MVNLSQFFTKKGLAGWWEYTAKSNWEISRGYVEEIETVAGESFDRYNQEKKTHYIHYDENEPPLEMEEHRGLDHITWVLEDIFKDHFPSLQRRSALITICTSFECELDELCNNFRERKNLKLSLKEITGKGVERASLYLEKVVGLDMKKETATWNEIKRIQRLRNWIVHQNAKSPERNSELEQYVACNPYLSVKDDEIYISKGYLKDVIDSFCAYFTEIAAANPSDDEL